MIKNLKNMKKGIVVLFVILAAIFIFSSCYNFSLRCIDGNGKLIEENRFHESFSQVFSAGSFDVLITNDTIYEIQIEAEENLMQYIETEVRGSKLYIEERENRCLRTNYPIVIRIKMPELTGVTLAGSGDIFCDSVNTEIFDIELLGSGNINTTIWADYVEATLAGSGEILISGEADQTDLVIPGSGNIRALDLVQNECYAEIAGSGNIRVYVLDYLNAKILGSGNIYYKGNPDIDYQILGSGDVIAIND